MLAPYVATGWWTAVEAQVRLLEAWGRAEEAIAQARPYARGGGFKLELLARLLVRHGCLDEALTRLIAGIEDPRLASALVELSEGAGRDEEIAGLLAVRIPAGHRCEEPWCCRGLDPDTALGLLAAVRERQGRVDEAIALLHTRQIASVNGQDQLADLLARQGRIEELRAYAGSDPHGHAVRRLAELLEESGDLDGALAVYRQPNDSPASPSHTAHALAALLVRHGRVDEAVEVMRTLADSPDGADDSVVDMLCTLYADHGRVADGLAYLDTRTARHDGQDETESLRLRLNLLAADGRLDEAIDLVGEHPEGGTWATAWTLSDLLAEAGRTGEAVAVLEARGAAHSTLLAGHLIDLGRVEEAVRILRRREPTPFDPVWSGTFVP
ncbi:tetratricopeptide repeat protein [Streptomyces sp. NPDC000075]|uniref:tetratricopeptide repeat protein n=1 Tax=Streptomyces TaxID=1883 RepID=UPI0031DEF5AB